MKVGKTRWRCCLPPDALQARQLAALAPVLPVGDPALLKPSTYDMVLAALLLHPAGEPPGPPPVSASELQALSWPSALGCAVQVHIVLGCLAEGRPLRQRLPLPLRPPSAPDHAVLLDCVRRWPQGVYDVAQLQATVLE